MKGDYMFLLPVVVSFVLSAILCKTMIPFLHKLKFGQFVRDDGPQSHLKKAGTPTMGGIMIVIAFTLTCVIFMFVSKETIPVVIMTLGFGLIGFLDDYIKVVKKRSLGLRAWQKLVLQFIVTAMFLVYYFYFSGEDTSIIIPFTSGASFTMNKILFIACVFFGVLGTVNAVNLTDGLDGLVSNVTIVVGLFFGMVSYAASNSLYISCCAVVGSLMGFLLFNSHPAKVFMGDTGSLALGGFVSAIAIMLHLPIFIVIVGIIYLVEAGSVIIQVLYFKATHGKRIFKMAPIHHHFEMCGFSESQIVTAFTIVTILASILGLAAL